MPQNTEVVSAQGSERAPEHGPERGYVPYQINKPTQTRRSLFSVFEVIYHATVRDLRKEHSNAFMGLINNMLQTVLFVLTFYGMFEILGFNNNGIRGDFLLYIMSGIFTFMTHTKSVSAMVGAEGPASPMMQHAPMTTMISMSAAALSALYIQTLSLVVILFFYHMIFVPVVIDNLAGAMLMHLLAWATGVGIGLVLVAMKPWSPDVAKLGSQIYSRISMIASGKMFVASTLPGYLLYLFEWNPLFHVVDQMRGFVFLHYTPRVTNVMYPVALTVAFLMLGLIGEYYTRKHASLSWGAKH